MQKTPAFTICSFSSWLTWKSCSKSKSKVLSFYKLRTPERNLKIIKISFHLCDLKCRQKLRPMILECWFYMFRGIYRHLIKAQEQIYSRFVRNVKLVKPTFSTRRGDTRTTAWACATCLLFENLLPVASYSRRVSDLKVPCSRYFSSSFPF